jgi:hypothetical protein
MPSFHECLARYFGVNELCLVAASVLLEFRALADWFGSILLSLSSSVAPVSVVPVADDAELGVALLALAPSRLELDMCLVCKLTFGTVQRSTRK